MTPKEKYISLAKELFESQERFSFPGIDPDAYARMKAAEEEYPGYTTPIDELIARFRQEGLKVALGKYPESGNVFILPAGSDDIEQDGISPGQLQVNDQMDEKLKTLILMSKR
jgi:hypothetical protein